MRVVICWGGVSGYMAACWRELASRADVDLLVLNFAGQTDTAFGEELLSGLNYRLLPRDSPDPARLIRDIVEDHRADVVSVSGWLHPAYLRLAADPALARVPFVMGMDTPLTRGWRQRAARFKLGSYLRRMSRVVVAGERAWQYARFLGVAESRLRRGVYGFDHRPLLPLHEQRRRLAGGWPRRFLFVGRYAPEKGIRTLLEAHALYRRSVADPWTLTLCGSGPEKSRISAAGPGVEDRGFVQPDALPAVWLEAGVFVLPSVYEPWGLVIAEAAGAGLPVICTEACGASVEVVRSMFNGLTVASGDAGALAAAMGWAQAHHGELAEMGRRGQELAAPYAAEVWADRWEHLLRELV